MGVKFGELTFFKHLVKEVWRINRSASRVLIVITNLDGFSLANHERFTKFANFPPPNFPVIQYRICASINIRVGVICESEVVGGNS